MTDPTYLVIDDEPQIRRVVVGALSGNGTRVLEAATGRAGIDLAAAERPTVVVLDLGLPDVQGIEVCREIRKWSDAVIVVLSARHAEQEKVALLDAGADDYVTKPFSTAELQARVRAQLRRRRTVDAPPPVVTASGVTVDLGRRLVLRDGGRVHLTPTEWDLLRVLVAHAGHTLTHRQLFAGAWGADASGDPQQNLRVHIARLRGKLEVDSVRPRIIVTEPGVGYRFDADAA
jgi:two-component system, OmpR family, KDP operon response regulator KdpE